VVPDNAFCHTADGNTGADAGCTSDSGEKGSGSTCICIWFLCIVCAILFTEQKRQYISEPFFDGAVFSVFLSGIFRTWLSGDRGTYRADRAAQTILCRDRRCALNCTVSLAGDYTGSDKASRRCDDSASANAGIFIRNDCYLFRRDCMGRKKRKAATGKTGGCFTAELSGTIHTGNLCDPFPLCKNSENIKS